nr:RhuM family protein [Veillonella caviae]
MGLITWGAAPDGKIVRSDVSVAKNYLSEKEMRSLERIHESITMSMLNH